MIEVCDENKCTGCNACVHVCPKKAITMVENSYGSLIPVINQKICVDCGLCQKVCQVENKIELVRPSKCYAVWTKNDLDRLTCSSGGVATGIGRYTINNGGIVFGAAYDDKLNLSMLSADNENDLLKFATSKYVQTNTIDSYVEVKRQLDTGRDVTYIGTPCQIAGLKKYLRKDYDNLLTVDIICHGVPPYAQLMSHVKNIVGEKKVTKVSFRGQYDFKLTLWNDNQLLYCKDRNEDEYFTAFLDGVNYRENCYSCQYAGPSRGSDITIGDFWGLDRKTLSKKFSGRISVVLLNTKKGNSYFDSIKELFEYEEREVDEAIKGNGQLDHPTRRPENRDIFLSKYENSGIRNAFKASGISKKVAKMRFNGNIVFRALRKVKRIIKGK